MKLFDRSEGLIFSVSLFALVTSEEMKLQFVMRACSLPFHHMQSLFKNTLFRVFLIKENNGSMIKFLC